MVHGFSDQLLLFEPLCRPPMQRLHLLGERVAQLLLEEMRKEGMVAVPLPVIVERHRKRFACSACSRSCCASARPVTATQSGAQSRSSSDVSSRKRCTG